MTTKTGDDLVVSLIASKTWFELKIMLSRAIMSMPETTDDDKILKYRLMKFMADEWPGHAPRSREIATMTSLLTGIQRDRDELKRLMSIPEIRKKTKT